MRILAVIPARGGSKGIPRKNVRLMNGKPLIYYAIHNALECRDITDLVVTSDDDEIKRIAQLFGAGVINRDPELARDATTLDPVIYDAVLQAEREHECRYDVVITLQPTSPLLKEETLSDAVRSFLTGNSDTYISAVNDPHLAWGEEYGSFFPLYEERKNRQQLPAHYRETGAFVISNRSDITPDTRFGERISVYAVPEDEAVDIDTPDDWSLCEARLKKKKIVLRTDGFRLIGMGHVYRCISLAQALLGHECVLVLTEPADGPEDRNTADGIMKVKMSHQNYRTVKDDTEFFAYIEETKPDIVVNDRLDTEAEYIRKIKKLVKRVVTIEDLGSGISEADAVINALYSKGEAGRNCFYGEKYICLRDEFLMLQDVRSRMKSEQEREPLQEILVLFGGADPSDLTGRLYKLAGTLSSLRAVHFTFITGPAYHCEEHGIVSDAERRIDVIQNVGRISDYMLRADIAVTSQGRTVYELAAAQVPSVVLAQNTREQLHEFAGMENGFLNLGLGSEVSDETLFSTLTWLLDTQGIREEMRALQRKHDLTGGIRRVTQIILGDTLE